VERTHERYLPVRRGCKSQPAQVLLMARSIRGWLYLIARLMGDVNAVKRGRVGRRIGRRVAGKVTGRAFRKLFG